MAKSRKTEKSDESSKSSIVKPIVNFGDDKKNALVELFDKDECPEIKSVGFFRVPGKKEFMSYVITSKGKEIINIEAGEPNLKAIAADEARIAFVTQILDAV